MQKQTAEQIKRLIDSGEDLEIVSGEGDRGTAEAYDGRRTVAAIHNRLQRERCGGDRWARVDAEDGRALAGVI